MTRTPAVFFDLDGTLIDDDASYTLAVAKACEELRRLQVAVDTEVLSTAYARASKTFWSNWRGGTSLDVAAVRRTLWVEAFAACETRDEALIDLTCEVYSYYRGETVVVYEDVVQVLTELQQSHRLVVITNGDRPTQDDKLARTGLDRYFDLMITATDYGVGKPEPLVFQKALDAVTADPAVTWHVGDHLHADVGGARSAGLRAAWLNRVGAEREADHPEPHAEITTLHELRALLLAPDA